MLFDLDLDSQQRVGGGTLGANFWTQITNSIACMETADSKGICFHLSKAGLFKEEEEKRPFESIETEGEELNGGSISFRVLQCK